jgi:hypothetical protein
MALFDRLVQRCISGRNTEKVGGNGELGNEEQLPYLWIFENRNITGWFQA